MARLTPAEALAKFESLPPIQVEELRGFWAGSEIPTGHIMDGLLEAYGWRGKSFHGDDQVDPLVMRSPMGTTYALQPALLPLGLLLAWPRLVRFPPLAAALRLVGPLARTHNPAACLRMVEHRGVVSCAMVYDHQPIIDHFRKLGPGEVMGMMTSRHLDQPFFFALTRDES